MVVETDSSTPGWQRRLGRLGATVLGVVLLAGGWIKAADPQALTEQIRVEKLDTFVSADVAAYIALGLEIGLGTALVLGVRRLWILLPTTLLVAFFLFLTGRGYWNAAHGVVDEAVSCGCFGNLVDRSPAEAFWQDLLLMVPALVLAFLGWDRGRLPVRRAAFVGVVTLAGLLFSWKAPGLPLDDWTTRLRPGQATREICSGAETSRICLNDVIPELEQGEHIVVLADLSSERFGEAVTNLNQVARSGQGPTLWILTAASPEERHRFFWQWAPSFEIREAPRTLIRPLYRSLPRSFVVSGGRVTGTTSGIPSFADRGQGGTSSRSITDSP